MIDYVVTGMVLHKPLTGYDIKKEIEAGIGHFYKSSYGNLYPALKKLTDKGLLALTEQTHVDRLKKYYIATELGKEAFLDWLVSPIDPSLGVAAILTKIYFFSELPVDSRNKLLHEYQLQCQLILDAYMEMEKQLSSSIGNTEDYYKVSTLYHGLQATQGMIDWLKNISEQKTLSEIYTNDLSQK